jgi:class 3 adenylate cyclase
MSGGPCPTCGAQPRAEARFCDACGAPLGPVAAQAEYKQVTVLFADVVHSMDIAAAVGSERLREIITELFNRSSAVVQRYGGTVDKFTGDGVMAVFGAPAVTILVESLLRRGAEPDVAEAKAAIDRLAAVPTDPGFVLHQLPLLRMRALMARAFGDESGYREFADNYRKMANDLDFEGHMAVAAAMP